MAEPQDMGERLRRPYAAAANVLGVLDRVRRINLPDAIDNDFLGITGVPDMALGRVQEALRFLGLIEPNGRPTETLRAMAAASDDEFQDLLSTAIRSAYADDFLRANPEVDTQARMVSAFKRYEPRSQTERMVMLWLGLLRAVGSPVLDAPRQRGMKAGNPRAGSPAARTTRAAKGPVRIVKAPAGSVPRIGGIPAGLFNVTLEDINALDEGDFKSVWDALGVIARARARSLRHLDEVAQQATERQSDEPADEEG